MLVGYPPFNGDDIQEIYESIKKGDLVFELDDWSDISDSAQDLIKKLLTVDVDERITGEQALKHPWIA